MDVKLVDRDPTPDETIVSVKSCDMVMVAERITVLRGMKDYPPPDSAFMPSSLTEELIYRLSWTLSICGL